MLLWLDLFIIYLVLSYVSILETVLATMPKVTSRLINFGNMASVIQ